MKHLLLIFCCLTTVTLSAQSKIYPVIKNAGPVLEVLFDSEKPDSTMEYNIVATIGDRSEKPTEVNDLLHLFARMYNAHIYGGVPREKLDVVLIIFAGATSMVLNNEAYQAKYKVDNPNLDVLNEIRSAGVKILVCAQSMELQRIDPRAVTPAVSPALSRFTALTTYQLKGYAPIIL